MESSVFEYDILLKNGWLIDAQKSRSKKDIAIEAGQIKKIDTKIPAELCKEVFDLSGYYITPGLIDMHTHIASNILDSLSVKADGFGFSYGVTTMVDAGTVGALDFPQFKKDIIDRSDLRILVFLNIVDAGMTIREYEQQTERMRPELVYEMVQSYPKQIVGVKTAHYWFWDPWDEEHPPWANVRQAVQAGELCQLPVMVDFWPRPPKQSYADLLLNEMRPGDIHTHVFAQQFSVINEDGTLNPLLVKARKRGIIFDLGHGQASFWFRNAVRAIQQGFLPDSISTDLHKHNQYGLVGNLLLVLNKILNMGVGLEEAIRSVTSVPAQILGLPELGVLAADTPADLAVFDLETGNYSYVDCGKATMPGNQRLNCVLTIADGKVVYNPIGLSLPFWEEAKGDYWLCKPTHVRR